MSLIGQFGVGFYSAFMVARPGRGRSRKAGEAEGWRWISDGKGEFTIEPDADAGARRAIIVHLREGEDEYLDPSRLRRIVHTYSDHIGLPIILKDAGKEETINTASALWTRPRIEITPEQYKEFYHHVGHSFDDPWLTLHNKAEGVLEYTSLLFVPSVKPFDLFDPERKSRVKLYVRRVFITDEGTDLLPRLSAVSARHCRQRGSAAQHQPRDAAVEPDGRAHAPAADPPGAERTRQKGNRGARRIREILGQISGQC